MKFQIVRSILKINYNGVGNNGFEGCSNWQSVYFYVICLIS